eukprot:4559791-Lingulodinium_polyedra.AAC.1
MHFTAHATACTSQGAFCRPVCACATWKIQLQLPPLRHWNKARAMQGQHRGTRVRCCGDCHRASVFSERCDGYAV